MKTFTVARISGLTLRQLQWWDEHRVVSPERLKGDNHPRPDRDYSYQEAAICCVAASLLEKGWTLRRIRLVLEMIRDDDLTGWLVVQSDFRFNLVNTFLLADPMEALRVVADHGGFCSVVDLGACLRLLKMETTSPDSPQYSSEPLDPPTEP